MSEDRWITCGVHGKTPASGRGWPFEGESTSAFALQFAALNAKWSGSARHSADGQGIDEVFDVLGRSYPRLPFPDMHIPVYPTRILGNDEVLIEAEADTWIWVTARTRRALEEVDALLRGVGMEWESITSS